MTTQAVHQGGGAASAVRPAIKPRRRAPRQWWQLFLSAPAVAFFTIAVVLPVFVAVWISVLHWRSIALDRDNTVSLSNYSKALTDPAFRDSIKLTVITALIGTVILNVAAVLMANACSSETRGSRFIRFAIVYPLALSPLVVGFVWRAFLGTDGLLDSIWSIITGHQLGMLANPALAMYAVAFVATWFVFGFVSVVYVAGIQAIPHEIHEAAAVDGASRARRFWHITLPMLKPTITVNVTLSLVIYLRIYEFPVAMTGGGPVGSTSTAAFMLVRDAFERSMFSYSLAQTVLFLMLVFLMAGTTLIILRRRED